MIRRLRPWRSVFLWFAVASTLFAGDGGGAPMTVPGVAGPEFADVFDAAAARDPAVGQWLEYRLAFPVDPLENSLRPDPIPAPGETGRDGYVNSLLGPETAWRVIPVRLEIWEVDSLGCGAVVVYEGGREAIYLPIKRTEAGADFLYDSDGGGLGRATARIGGVEHAVEETRRSGIGYGFVRWFSPDVPFGVVRFATEYVDVTLVDWGDNARSAPEFPLRVINGIEPPPGLLYSSGGRADR